ncbi:MAG: nuclear transport factor 2 family protein [Chloroflexota bacterium]
MDRAAVAAWLDRYVAAWKSYDPQAIGDLFSEDATYGYHPWDDPVKGREAIVADWLKSPDAPETWQADYAPFAVDGDKVVVTGWTNYFSAETLTLDRKYYNVWLLRFDENGRCREFVEVFMEAPVKEA